MAVCWIFPGWVYLNMIMTLIRYKIKDFLIIFHPFFRKTLQALTPGDPTGGIFQAPIG